MLDPVRDQLRAWLEAKPALSPVDALERLRGLHPDRFSAGHLGSVQRFMKVRRLTMAREVLLGPMPRMATLVLNTVATADAAAVAGDIGKPGNVTPWGNTPLAARDSARHRPPPPSQGGQSAGSRIAGMRLWTGATVAFASVVMVAKVRVTPPSAGSVQFSHGPPKASGAPSVRAIAKGCSACRRVVGARMLRRSSASAFVMPPC